MKATLFFVFVFLFVSESFGQLFLNQTDPNHLKQGKWIVKYPDGKVRYEGSFSNNKPVGEWKRFHENGKLKAILRYAPNADKIKAELYDPNGTLFSKGNFIGKDKDSVWTFFENQAVVSREAYTRGIKNGKSASFYPDGKPAVETEWLNGKLSGIKREYYPSGKKKSEMHYIDDKRQGESRSYFNSGQTQIEGRYANDNYDGPWTFYDEKGRNKLRLEYKNGTLLNSDKLDSLQMLEFKSFEKMKGSIKDPEKYLGNPDEFLRKQ